MQERITIILAACHTPALWHGQTAEPIVKLPHQLVPAISYCRNVTRQRL